MTSRIKSTRPQVQCHWFDPFFWNSTHESWPKWWKIKTKGGQLWRRLSALQSDLRMVTEETACNRCIRCRWFAGDSSKVANQTSLTTFITNVCVLGMEEDVVLACCRPFPGMRWKCSASTDSSRFSENADAIPACCDWLNDEAISKLVLEFFYMYYRFKKEEIDITHVVLDLSQHHEVTFCVIVLSIGNFRSHNTKIPNNPF